MSPERAQRPGLRFELLVALLQCLELGLRHRDGGQRQRQRKRQRRQAVARIKPACNGTHGAQVAWQGRDCNGATLIYAR